MFEVIVGGMIFGFTVFVVNALSEISKRSKQKAPKMGEITTDFLSDALKMGNGEISETEFREKWKSK